MKAKAIIKCILLTSLTACAYADVHQHTTGDNSPTITAAGDATVNYHGVSKQEVDEIVAPLARQHQLDTEQINNLTAIITNLSQGKGVSASPSQINAAIDALKLGHVDQAKALFVQETQRVELAAKQGAQAYRNLGALAFLNNTQEALQAYRRATQLDTDDADGWNQLGHLLSRTGDLDGAIAAYNTVITLGKKHGDKQEITRGLGNLGIVHQTRGDLELAAQFLSKALKLNEGLNIKEGMAADYANLGNVHQAHGDLELAAQFYGKALKLHKGLGSKEGMAADYGNLGLLHVKHGDLELAAQLHSKALKLHEGLGSKEGMAINYANLGDILKFQGNKAEAKRLYLKSIELFKQLGSPNEKKAQALLDALE